MVCAGQLQLALQELTRKSHHVSQPCSIFSTLTRFCSQEVRALVEILDVDFSNDLDIEEWSRFFSARRISISEFGGSCPAPALPLSRPPRRAPKVLGSSAASRASLLGA